MQSDSKIPLSDIDEGTLIKYDSSVDAISFLTDTKIDPWRTEILVTALEEEVFDNFNILRLKYYFALIIVPLSSL